MQSGSVRVEVFAGSFHRKRSPSLPEGGFRREQTPALHKSRRSDQKKYGRSKPLPYGCKSSRYATPTIRKKGTLPAKNAHPHS